MAASERSVRITTPRSLNVIARNREKTRIDQENLALAKRLLEKYYINTGKGNCPGKK